MSNKKQTYTIEKREVTNDHRQALDHIKQAGELTKPYMSQVLGSYSVHIYAVKNPLTGLLDIGFQTISTEMPIKAEILQGLLQPMKDNIDRLLGATRYVSRGREKDEKEEQKEVNAKLAELGLVSASRE